ANGFARTASPPYTGPTQPGISFVGFGDPFALGEVRGRIYLTLPLTGIDATSALVAFSAAGPLGIAIGAPMILGSMFALTLQIGVRQLTIVDIPADGSLVKTLTTQVEVRADRTADFATTFNNTPSTGGPGARPEIDEARLEFDPV